ncbi:ABC transporter permease [Acidithiobacillus ferridurans]|uniref:ABC transporter permease n=1 Tax=Acidithiobacillus ferridurans TaxID=1232575 RepID=UPI001C07DDA6|nr:ABC transporter permease [Acidithiobacillus ferridurans]MBU2732689.1 ABC transporter permease [Acidithiobacillus ferridurans]
MAWAFAKKIHFSAFTKNSGSLLALPAIGWIIAFLLLPSLLFLPIALTSDNPYGLPTLPITMHALREVAGFNFLGWSAANIHIILRSLWQGLLTTIVSLIVAYPVAFFIAKSKNYLKPLLLVLIILPSWTNQVVRAYAWMELLGPNALLSHLAVKFGWIDQDMGLYPSTLAVFIGLIYSYLPYMVIPIYAALEGMDWSLTDAATDLYAQPIDIFWRVILPQSMGGVLIGIVLVLIPSFSNYIIPELMGGNKSLMLGNLIAEQFSATPNWPYGAALSVLLILLSFLLLAALRPLSKLSGNAQGPML